MLVTNLSNTHFSIRDINGTIRIFYKNQVKDLSLANDTISIVINSVNNQEFKIMLNPWSQVDVYDLPLGAYLIENTSFLTSKTATLNAIFDVIWGTPITIPGQTNPETIIVAASDETTDLILTPDAVSFNMPYDGQILSIKANVNNAPTGDDLEIDILKNAVSIFSSPLRIDDGDTTSIISTTPAVIATPLFLNDDKITIAITNIGSTNPGKGLKITFRIGGI